MRVLKTITVPAISAPQHQNCHLQCCPKEVVTLLWPYTVPHEGLPTASVAAYCVWGPSRKCDGAPLLHSAHQQTWMFLDEMSVSQHLYLLQKLRRARALTPIMSSTEQQPVIWIQFVCFFYLFVCLFIHLFANEVKHLWMVLMKISVNDNRPRKSHMM